MMKIAIYVKNTQNSYSGGRFYTMFLATALTYHHEVTYVSNIYPIFARDFEMYPSFSRIHFHIDEDFLLPSSKTIDLSIIIPSLDTSLGVYYSVVCTHSEGHKLLDTAIKTT